MALQKTGVFATPEQLQELKVASAAGYRPNDPYICFSIADGLRREEATLDATKLCHKFALEAGLPEIEGYYGILEDGEFVRM